MFTRNFIAILAGNILLGSAMPMLIILGGLAGAWLAPQSWLATTPPTVQAMAGIAVATPISLFMGRFGRRLGFALGAACLVLGGLLGLLALLWQSFALLCVAHVVLGAALVCVNYFRFAAAEAVPTSEQPRAISLLLASGLVAALLGPELFTWTRDSLPLTPLGGAYAAIAVMGVIGAVPLLFLQLERPQASTSKAGFGQAWTVLRANPQALGAMAVSGLAFGMMVLMMTPTPIAMIGCGFSEDQAADVIRWHVIAMFAPGFVTGSLIKRFGVYPVMTVGGIILLTSAVVALSGLALGQFYLALVLLGIGWNFAFIGGTQILQSSLSEQERPTVQGLNDTLIAAIAATASLTSGVAYAGIGWLGLAGVAAPVFAVLGFWVLRINRTAQG